MVQSKQPAATINGGQSLRVEPVTGLAALPSCCIVPCEAAGPGGRDLVLHR